MLGTGFPHHNTHDIAAPILGKQLLIIRVQNNGINYKRQKGYHFQIPINGK